MRSLAKKALSLLLAAALLPGCVSAALASVQIVSGSRLTPVSDASEEAAMVSFFNDSVNVIKTDLPKMTVAYKNYVPTGGMTTTGDGEVEELDDMGKKYLIPVLEGLFNGRSSLAKSFVQTMMGKEGNAVEEIDLHRGMLRNTTVPVYGQNYVSELAPAEDYVLYADMTSGGKTPSRISVEFTDCTLEDGKKGSLSKVFSLPKGTFDPTVFSGARTEVASRLDDAKFSQFDIKNAKIVTEYDKNGRISYYRSAVEYHFAISFYDCMNLISVVLGYDFYNAVIEMVNPILERVSKPGISKEDVLSDRQIHVIYRSEVELTDFDFSSRWFGDINDDGRVSADDARLALRHAVKLETITYSDDRIYADVNFDGQISASDARDILRMAVGLAPMFKDVPAGKKIKIVKVEEDPAPPEQETQEDIKDEQGKIKAIAGLFDDYDPGIKLADIVKGVFNYIDMVEGSEEGIRNYITELVNAAQEAGKKDEGEPGGGTAPAQP